MRELSAQELALAIAIVVSHQRTRKSRRKRLQSAYIDDCLAVLENPAFNPNVRRFTSSDRIEEEARRVRLCEETRELYESMEPLIRALTRES